MEIKDGQTSTRVHKTPMSKKMTNPQDKAKFKIMQTNIDKFKIIISDFLTK